MSWAVAGLAVVLLGLSAWLILGSDESPEQQAVEVSTVSSNPAQDRARRINRLEKRLRKQERAALEAAAAEAQASRAIGSGSSGANKSFDGFADNLAGEVGIAFVPAAGEPPQVFGSLQSGAAWSTIKVALALRTIADAGGVEQLSSAEVGAISSALTASDNAAAMTLWDGIVARTGSPDAAATSVGEVLARAGDTGTTVSSQGRAEFSPYGQTEWGLSGQAQFMQGVATGAVEGTDYVLAEMGGVVPDQRWGLGTVGSSAFKGGWGPSLDGRYLVRQMGTLNGGSIALAATADDGTFESGTALLNDLAGWASENLGR